jgi:hypothetical protein
MKILTGNERMWIQPMFSQWGMLLLGHFRILGPDQCWFFVRENDLFVGGLLKDTAANEIHSWRSRTPMPKNVLFTWPPPC